MNPTTTYEQAIAGAKGDKAVIANLQNAAKVNPNYFAQPTPTTPAPTNETLGSVLGTYNAPEDPSKINYDLAPQEEQNIRNQTMGMYQAEINAAKAAYSNLLAEQKQQGIGRLGETNAVQARRGLIGSSFGTGMTESARGTNLKNEQSVMESQERAISEIMARANKAAQDEISAKRLAKKEGINAYSAYLKELPTARKNYASEIADTLLNQGLDYSALSASDITQLKNNGISQQDIISAYLEKKKVKDEAEAEQAQKGIFTLGEGQARYDAQGNLIASRAKTYAPKETGVGGTGSIYDRFDAKTAAAIIKEGDKFGNTPIVKKYNDIVSAANFINATDPNSQNAAAHQAMVYNFAKMLDPDSVVREGEYNTVKKYSQSLLSRYGGEIKQAVNGTGFLSPGAIQAIQEETKNRVNAYTPQYTNIKKQYSNRIKNISGQDVGDMVLSDYEEGYTAGQGQAEQTIIAPDGQEVIIID